MKNVSINSAVIWIMVVFLFIAITLGLLTTIVETNIRNQEQRTLMQLRVEQLANNADILIVDAVEQEITTRLATHDMLSFHIRSLTGHPQPPVESILFFHNFIHELITTTPMVDDIVLYIPAHNMLIRGSGIIFLSELMNQPVAERYDFLDAMHIRQSQWFLRPADGGGYTLTMARAYPVGMDTLGRLPLVAITLNENILAYTLYQSLTLAYEGLRVFITDPAGTILSATDTAYIGVDLSYALNTADAFAESMSQNGRLIYVMAAEPDFRAGVGAGGSITVWLVTSILLLIVGFFSVVGIQVHHYIRPLRKLLQRIGTPEAPSASRLSHFERIEMTISTLSDEKKSLTRFVSQNQEALRNAWLNRFVNGESVHQMPPDHLNISFPYPFFQVLLLKGVETAPEKLLQLFQRYELFSTPQRELLLLINHEEASPDGLYPCIEAVISEIPGAFIGIGPIVGMDDVKAGVRGARHTLSAQFFDNTSVLQVYTDSPTSQVAVTQQIIAHFRRLAGGFHQYATDDEFNRDVEAAIKAMADLKPSMDTVRTLMMMAAVYLTKPAYDLFSDPTVVFNQDLVPLYYALPNIHAFHEQVLKDSRRLRDYIKSTQVDSSASIAQYAVHQINNMAPHDLSVQAVADALHISASHLSRLFHQEMGMKLMDFLHETRMEHACRLLKDCDDSTEDICTKIGYTKPQYFNKKFKERWGLTPRQYRQQVRSNPTS